MRLFVVDMVFRHVCDLYKVREFELRRESRVKMTERARAAAAALLSEYLPEHDHEKIAGILKCSQSFVERRVKLSRSQSPGGKRFRDDLIENFDGAVMDRWTSQHHQ